VTPKIIKTESTADTISQTRQSKLANFAPVHNLYDEYFLALIVQQNMVGIYAVVFAAKLSSRFTGPSTELYCPYTRI